jgi:hypothetical protein
VDFMKISCVFFLNIYDPAGKWASMIGIIHLRKCWIESSKKITVTNPLVGCFAFNCAT